jgi:predicted nucleic-acid-binding Zn-ribbon protein
MSAKNKCVKCGTEMVDGFVLNHGDYASKGQQIWVAGQPESSLWSGLKTSDRDIFKVQAFRCADCIFLEFYTTDRIYL